VIALYEVCATATFAKSLRQHRRNAALVREVDRKLSRLQVAPEQVGGALAGKLHGYRSTRVLRKFRLIFSIDVDARRVLLHALNHRKDAYSR